MMSRLSAWMMGGEGRHATSDRRLQWRIFWVALTIRLLYITLAHTYRIRPFLDNFQFGWEVGRIARAVATGYGYADPFTGHTGPTAWSPPLFTLLLAGVFKIFGAYSAASAWVIFAIDSIFSAVTAALVFEIARRCYAQQQSVALWSGWLWALYPAAMQYAVRWVWDMTLTTFLFTLTLVIALRVGGIGEPSGSKNSTIGRWAAFGLLWGLICLSNSTLVLFLPLCGIWMLLGHAKQRGGGKTALAHAALAAVLFLACLTPWVWRNWTVMHTFIATRGNLGAEMYQSILPEHEGFPWGTTVSYYDATPDYQSYKALGEVAYVRQKGDLANAYIRTHRVRFVELVAKRIYFYWVGVPHPFEQSIFVEIVRELNYSFLSLSGLLGLALSIHRKIPGAWLFAWAFALLPVPYYLITVQARFRHPLEPLIAIFAVFLFQSAQIRSGPAIQPASGLPLGSTLSL